MGRYIAAVQPVDTRTGTVNTATKDDLRMIVQITDTQPYSSCKMPVAYNGNLIIDWGAPVGKRALFGPTSTYVSFDPSAANMQGVCDIPVTVSGEVTGLSFLLGATAENMKVKEVRGLGITNKYTALSFNSAYSLLKFTPGECDTSGVTNLSYLFNSCYSLTSADLSTMDTSGVTNMMSMFYSCGDLNNPDLRGLVTSACTNLSSMFCVVSASGVAELTAVIGLDTWDTSSVTNMSQMFWGTEQFDPDVSMFDISSLTNSDKMFLDAALSTVNYDKLLIAWAAQTVKPNVPFHAGTAKYTNGAASAARAVLTGQGWTITDGGQV